ncbi:MAG: hypothetical protein ACT4OY_00680 [Alphaproteobacteria bacterium]
MEKGNVLFLILIAVALFAALSYAVTQSSRSGGGDAGSEASLVSSAQITQYPASVRTSIIRQLVGKNVSVSSLAFNQPSAFAACTGTVAPNCVFYPTGGSATYVPAPGDVVTTNNQQDWVFNGENEINLVGTTTGSDGPTSSTAEVIAFLPNVKTDICKKINSELGVNSGNVPTETNLNVTTYMVNGTGLVSTATGGTIGEDVVSLDAQAFGCFVQGGVNYYFHVLIEQ